MKNRKTLWQQLLDDRDETSLSEEKAWKNLHGRLHALQDVQ